MLPNNFNLNKATEDRLKLLKVRTAIPPNVSSRIAFFKSLASGFESRDWNYYVVDGALKLDKLTWLGSSQLVIETVLKNKYPHVTSAGEIQKIWAMHVEYGSAAFHNRHDLSDFIKKVVLNE